MTISMETATFIMVAIQAVGTFSAIVYAALRMERRFTRLEVNMEWLKNLSPERHDTK